MGKFCSCNESKETYIVCIPETNPFKDFIKMLYSIKIKKYLKELKKLEEKQSQLNDTRAQEKLGKQILSFDWHKDFEPVTKTIKHTMELLT